MKKVVITGSPGTGKTAIIKGLEEKGYTCFHEIIRTMTADAKSNASTKKQVSNPLVFVDDPYSFNKELLHGRLEHFKKSDELAVTTSFFDRGMPDVLAYMDYFNQPYKKDFKQICSQHSYTSVFILPPWKEIYVSDNERLETFEEATEIDTHLIKSYKEFDYSPILVPKTTVEKRISFILDELKHV